MAFTVSEVIRVACRSRSWYVYAPTRQTSHVNDFVNGKSHARAETSARARSVSLICFVVKIKFYGEASNLSSTNLKPIYSGNVMSCNMKKGLSGSKLQDVL